MLSIQVGRSAGWAAWQNGRGAVVGRGPSLALGVAKG